MVEERENENNQIEEKQLTCPECGKGFQDMRGLTSHARHSHDLSKEKIKYEIAKREKSINKNLGLKILGGVGVILLTTFTSEKMR